MRGRLSAALADGRATVRDLAPLLRQERLRVGPGGQVSEVPAHLDPDDLKRLGLVVESGRVQRTVPYRPTWLGGPVEAIDEAGTAGGAAAPTHALWESVPADPIVEDVLGYEHYRGVPQREAVRAALRAPDGEVMGVVLPTGTGKSLVAQVRGVAGRGTTVVVVPTVALALDQQTQLRRERERLGLPVDLAYHGGLDDSVKSRIRERLANGEQKILFCSPEAAVGSLVRPLLDLCERGGLGTLVIDECHLVDAWGDSFRPAFQLLPALRRLLVARCKAAGVAAPLTVLLTATMTQDTLEILGSLFELSPDHLVEAQHLRREPRYLTAVCTTEASRESRLHDLLDHVPRPAIVYATRPRDAMGIARRLRSEGFSRVTEFHGEMGSQARADAMEAWAGTAPSADVMVATSAFGLGVNVPDVRTIIHACLPESVDRFYQEVGRSGRDQQPSVSISLPVLTGGDDDLAIARSLARRKTIGSEKGSNRWRSMRRSGALEDDALMVDTAVLPEKRAGLDQSVDLQGDRNRLWNWATLNLLARSRSIRVQLRPGATPPDGADESAAEAHYREEANRVHVLPGEIGFPPSEGSVGDLAAAFERKVAEQRERSIARSAASLGRILEVVRGTICVAEALGVEYGRTVTGPAGEALVAPAGGCQGCPRCGSRRVAAARSLAAPVPLFEQALGRDRAHLAEPRLVLVGLSGEPRARRREVEDVLRRCLDSGVRHVVLLGPAGSRRFDAVRLVRLAGPLERVPTVDRRLDLLPPGAPCLIVVGSGDPVPVQALASPPRALRVLAIDNDAVDPRHADRGLRVRDTELLLRPSELDIL